MRLRNWVGVGLSVLTLVAIGSVGIVVNNSALRAADSVHRSDSRALGVNNATLTGQLQLLSAKELNEFAADSDFNLRAGDLDDRAALRRLTGSSEFFKYGAVLTSLDGTLLSANRDDDLPALDDPGLTPMFDQLGAGQPGFSSVLRVGSQLLAAAAIPVVVDGRPAGVLIGFVSLADSQLQAYTARLGAPGDVTSVVDSTGRVAASSDPDSLGADLDPAIGAILTAIPEDNFVEYESGGTEMIAVVVGAIPGGWAYVREQTRDSFNGSIVSRNQTTTLILIAMLLIGVAVVSLFGYRIELQRRRSEQRFEALFQNAPDMVSVLDEQARTLYASPSAAALLGADARVLRDAPIFDFVHPEDRPWLKADFVDLRKHPDRTLRRQCRILTASRTIRWVEFTASNQLQNPSLNGVVINARDVTETRAFQDRLAYEATHDSLTGLPNRRYMNERLHSLLRDQPVGVLFIDLDGFKAINDTYGHEAGDELLRQVAALLSEHLQPHELLARAGGDEFVVLMPGMVRYFEAQALADRLRIAIETSVGAGAGGVFISASIGVHLATPADNPDHVLRAADHAMYAIKQAGGGRSLTAGPQAPTILSSGRHRTGS